MAGRPNAVTIEIRPVSADELPEMRRVSEYAFANNTPDDAPAPAPMIPEWTTCAFVDGRMAVSFAAFPFRIRLNGASVAAAGVTMVATLPEFRRLGLLRRVMTQSFADQREAGQSLAILWASRGAIYQRYGYGPGTDFVGYGIDPRQIVFVDPVQPSGRVRLMPMADARRRIEAIYKDFSRPRNLMIQRAPALWDVRLQDPPGSRMRVGVYANGEGADTGYVVFSIGREDGEQVFAVNDLCYLDLDAYHGIWSFFAVHDIVKRIDFGPVAPDDPAPALLVEPRELHRTTRDGVWMRVTDVAEALRQRRYGDEGMLTIAVRDELCEWNNGTFGVEATGAGNDVTRANESDADLAVPVRHLASLVAGNRTPTWLANAGLIDVPNEKALRVADQLFATRFAPWCPDGF